MRENRSSGSVEGVMSNRDPYSDFRERLAILYQRGAKEPARQLTTTGLSG